MSKFRSKLAMLSLLSILLCLTLLFGGCAAASGVATEADAAQNGVLTVSFDYLKQSGYATNQFAVWVETADGAFVKTLYATEFTADGGYKDRPDAISAWVARSGLAEGKNADAVSGATPSSGALQYRWDRTDETGTRVPDGTYRFFVEGTLRWKNSVQFTGEIAVGDAPASAEAVAQYHFEASGDQAALTEASEEVQMIGAVRADYTPPEAPAAN